MTDKHILLIVEDEATAAKALERKFRASGFEATVCGDGEEALKAVAHKTFDVILLDLVLPKKDGYEVLKALKDKGNATPVVVLTNLCAESDASRTKELGAAAHFVKSMTPMKEVVSFILTLLTKQA